jgi:hypothetical protein
MGFISVIRLVEIQLSAISAAPPASRRKPSAFARAARMSGLLATPDGWSGGSEISRVSDCQTHVAPGIRSGDHHHGEAETAIYVLSGKASWSSWRASGRAAYPAGPGDELAPAGRPTKTYLTNRIYMN